MEGNLRSTMKQILFYSKQLTEFLEVTQVSSVANYSMKQIKNNPSPKINRGRTGPNRSALKDDSTTYIDISWIED